MTKQLRVHDSDTEKRRRRRSSGPVFTGTSVVAPSPEPALLQRYRLWMISHRGLTPTTLKNHGRVLRELVAKLGDDPHRYVAGGLIGFLLEYQSRHGRNGAHQAACMMRVFLRYLAAEGQCACGLDAAIPRVRTYRLSSLPRYLTAEQVELILATCDRATAIGLRARAVLLLLARLGLRSGDVVRLRLQDVDAEEGTLRLAGKGRREARLPLTQELADALVDYLERGRPAAPFDRLFLSVNRPVKPWSGENAVSQCVARHMRRAGISSPGCGAHVLRHSAATEMLRQGASLDEIGAVLRHRSRQTTAIYAKVDINLLKMVAQPWPEVIPC